MRPDQGPAPPPRAARKEPGATLKAGWQADLHDKPLSLAAVSGPAGVRLAVGQANGLVSRFAATGQPAGEVQTAGPVYALLGADLTGDGDQELLVGSDDETPPRAALRPHGAVEMPGAVPRRPAAVVVVDVGQR